MSGRFQTRVEPSTGRTIRSGLNTQYSSGRNEHRAANQPYRAVVLKTYASDDPVRTENGRSGTERLYEVECDVLLARSLTFLPRVPVAQRNHGLCDADLWIPRPSTRALSGQELNLTRVSLRGTPSGMPTALSELDGDQVMVEFIEGDIWCPIIVGATSHVRTKRLVVDGSGWQEGNGGSERGTAHLNERYFRYRGVEARINDVGDVLLDTVGATSDTDTEEPGATGGQVRLRIKSSERFTVEMNGTDVLEVWQDSSTGQVHIDLGEGATEQLVRGNKLTTWLLAHTHPDAMGGTLIPLDPAGGVSLNAGDHLSEEHKVK